jgi:hypothetical protein
MCNLYSLTKPHDAMRRLFRFRRDLTGNLPPRPDIFPTWRPSSAPAATTSASRSQRGGAKGPEELATGDRRHGLHDE